MTIYSLQLEINKNEECSIINFNLDLPLELEDNPKNIFTEAVIYKLSQQVKLESNCYLTPLATTLITDKWGEDISLGYRQTRVSIDLPSIDTIDPAAIADEGTDDFEYIPIAVKDITMIEFFVDPELNF